MFGLGMGELVIILVVVLLLFGAKKLPQLGKAVGSSINNFKEGLKEGQKIEDKTDSDDKPEGSV